MKAKIFAMEAMENGEGKVSFEVQVTDIDTWKKLWIKSDQIDIDVDLSRSGVEE
jgi:hypothetical protein